MAVVRWIFTDGVTSVTLPINPSDISGDLFESASVTTFTTLTGRVLVTEGAPTPGTIQFSGDILQQTNYEIFLDWMPKGPHGRRRITITDHYGRHIVGILTSWQPTPKRSPSYPWRHTYVASFLVISVGSPA